MQYVRGAPEWEVFRAESSVAFVSGGGIGVEGDSGSIWDSSLWVAEVEKDSECSTPILLDSSIELFSPPDLRLVSVVSEFDFSALAGAGLLECGGGEEELVWKEPVWTAELLEAACDGERTQGIPGVPGAG